MNALVDSGARKKLALLARRLAAGRISNRDFERALPTSREAALHDIYVYGLWPLYDDITEHKLLQRCALTREGKTFVARVVLFLRSETPYRYPRLSGMGAIPILVLSILSFGWFGRMWRRHRWAGGDESVWPFFSRAEFEAACQHPPYLSGAAAQQILPADRPPAGGR